MEPTSSYLLEKVQRERQDVLNLSYEISHLSNNIIIKLDKNVIFNSPNNSESGKQFIKFLYTNPTSFTQNKLHELELMLSYTNPSDVIMLTETWFTNSSIVNITNFSIFRKDRDSKGGGVCIYVSNHLKS